MKFLFFTDTHIRGSNPRSRIDSFQDTLMLKLNELVEISNEYQVDYILHGGDWFDRPDVSPAVVRDFAMIIKKFNKPIYTVAGNHDIYGHNPGTLSRTMLGLIEALDVVKMLDNNENVLLAESGLTVQLSGASYNTQIDGENFKDFYMVKKQSNVDYAIHIVHAMLLDKPFYEGIRYTLIDDIKQTEADITLAGHYHTGFGIINSFSKYFINPGSLMRISASKAEVKRMPQVIIIEIDDTGINAFPIILKSAKLGSEVLDRTEIEHAQSRSISLINFFNSINTGKTEFDKIDIQEILLSIASSEDISDDIKMEAIKRIELARESLLKGEET